MSYFKTKAVIINKKRQSNGENIYFVFSYDYGKIVCMKKHSKKEKELDVGHLVNLEIESKKGNKISKIKNIKILREYRYEDQKYKVIESFLKLIATVSKECPENLPNYQIFDCLETLMSKEEISSEKIILTHLKILNLIGTLSQEDDNKIIQKILKFIHLSPISKILLLKIDENIKKDLEKFIL